MKRRPWAAIARGPHAASMCLDDGSTNREAHAHAIRFGCKERTKQFILYFWIDTGSQVLHRDDDFFGSIACRSDQELPRSVGSVRHCLDSIHDEIDDHLL